MDEIASRIAGLREALDRYNYAYYVLSAPEISDKVFDEMMKELEERRLERVRKMTEEEKALESSETNGEIPINADN